MGSCSEIVFHQTTKEMAKFILLLFILATSAVMFANGKICWKPCTDGDAKLVRNFNIDGCRRRRSVPGRGRPRFRCDGDIGPPCIVKRGDTVYLGVASLNTTALPQKLEMLCNNIVIQSIS